MSKNKIPMDNVNGLVITLRVSKKGTGHDISHFMEKNIESEGELINIATRAAKLLWECRDVKSI